MLTSLNDAIHTVDWELLQRLTQIAFFVITGIVAVLTFRAARKTLLNTVYNEYHKKVIDNLYLISGELFEEFDNTSPKHWSQTGYNDKFAKSVYEMLDEFDTGDLPPEAFHDLAYPYLDEDMRVRSLATRYETDPFLPDALRQPIVAYYRNWETLGRLAIQKVMDNYSAALVAHYSGPRSSARPKIPANAINSALYEYGVGIAQREEAAFEIRRAIAHYFSDFNAVETKKQYTLMRLGQLQR